MARGEGGDDDEHVVPEGLVWSSDDRPGIRRIRRGKGFSYKGADGAALRPVDLDRIKSLVIPPAWSEVWINPSASGHIQATGRDARGRKQYRYHPDWSAARAGNKFDRLPAFARSLPRLRRRIEADLSQPGMGRDKVLAATVRLLELTLIRVGNAEYARRNRSYGLTTLHKKHLTLEGTAFRFRFRGKCGVDHEVGVRDRRLARIIRSFQELPGQVLFKYREADGGVTSVSSDDVNAYIRAVMGDDFSAKDFRTWAGTISAARLLREAEPPMSAVDARTNINRCIKTVSGLLGNTVAVCRTSYIHPVILTLYEQGGLAELPAAESSRFESALMKRMSG